MKNILLVVVLLVMATSALAQTTGRIEIHNNAGYTILFQIDDFRDALGYKDYDLKTGYYLTFENAEPLTVWMSGYLRSGFVSDMDKVTKYRLDPGHSYTFVDVDGYPDMRTRQTTFPVRTCTECIPASIVAALRNAIPTLAQYANTVAPSSYETPNWIDVGPADIKFRVSRSPLVLALDGNRLTASVRGGYWIAVSNLVLGARFDTASCGIGEPLRIVDVKVSVVVRVMGDNKLTSKTTIDDLSFPNRCKLTIADIDVTDRIGAAVRPQLQSLADALDTAIARIDLRNFR